MKQIVQSIKDGQVLLIDAPVPDLPSGFLLVQNAVSLVSAGTERMTVEFSKKNLVQKARARPDLVKQFMDKAKRDGIISAFDAVKTRLDQPLPLGYSTAGVVIDVGDGVTEFKPGDRVACAGVGYANHAEVICVPKNLVAKLPDNVDFESGAFGTLGAIALQGIRLSEAKLGESVAIIGLGLLGQLTVQMLKAAGCVVVGIDPKEGRAELAEESGADWVSIETDDFVSISNYFTGDKGVDAVIITAATKSNEPVELAGNICRDRGIVVAVGAVNMEIPRKTYYEKELDFRISRSYGPGRYDVNYEEKGRDYPIGYVRWTEQRNMQAFLNLIAAEKLNLKKIITHRFTIDNAIQAYDLITSKGDESYLGILIKYDTERRHESKVVMTGPAVDKELPVAHLLPLVKVGLLGCGNFPSTTLLPAIRNLKNIELVGAYDPMSANARHVTDKFGFKYCTGKEKDVIGDPDINTIIVATRHNMHYKQVIAGLAAGKNVFCEKPLCISEAELNEIITIHDQIYRKAEKPRSRDAVMQRSREAGTIKDTAGMQGSGDAGTTKEEDKKDQKNQKDETEPIASHQLPILMVGYNRRFSPMVQEMKNFVANSSEPAIINYRVNAGSIPLNHWTQDLQQGGGRVIGEACHFVDLMVFLTGSFPVEVFARSLPNNNRYNDDNICITVEFVNGSLGTIIYLANGDKSFSKERIEIFKGGMVGMLDDFRRLELIKNGRRKSRRSILRQDKGHREEWLRFSQAVIQAKPSPIFFNEVAAVSRTTFAILKSIKETIPVTI